MISAQLRKFITSCGSIICTGSSTKTIQALCKAGRTDIAREVFDELPEKSVISFSAMIYGYSSNGFLNDSLNLFSHMRKFGIYPNSFTYVAVLLSIVGMQNRRLGECMHSLILKSGLQSNVYVGTAMIDAYAKCGSIEYSYALFSEMAELNLVTCNAMLAGFVHNNLFEEAVLLFKKFFAMGLMPNCVTMLSVSQSCAGYGLFKLCESLHGYILKTGFDLDIAVMNSVLQMYLTSDSVDIASDFFWKMVEKDVISWTSMMTFLLELEHANNVLDMFRNMRAYGSKPDMVVLLHLMTACALLGDLRKGLSMHSQIIVTGLQSELHVVNSLISMYSKCADFESASVLFHQLQDRTLVSWTAMITGYVQNGKPKDALKLFGRMREEDNFSIDCVTLCCLFTACSELESWDVFKQFHAYSCKSGLLTSTSVQNSLIAFFGKNGCIDLAEKAFNEMANRDRVSYNVLISAYGINGEILAALRLFQEMGDYGKDPDDVTYLNILSACNHAGYFEDGLSIFTKMVKEKKVEPSSEHYRCLADMLGRAGKFEDARNIAASLSDEGGENVWKVFLGSYHTHYDNVLADFAAHKVLERNSEDSGLVVLLSNVYASLGKFEDVEALRSSIGTKGLKKISGFSLLPHDAN